MLSAETAERLLGAEPPNVGLAREMLGDIRHADQHATEIISHVKNLLKRRSEIETHEFDLNEVISHAMLVLAPEAKMRNVTLRAWGPAAIASTRRSDPPAKGHIEPCDERYGRDGQRISRRPQNDHSNGVAGRFDG